MNLTNRIRARRSAWVAGVIIICVAPLSLAADPRQQVDMPPPMREHLLGNMRDHLLALAEIQSLLGAGKPDQAGDIAETRLGMSSLETHGASHMAPLMPQGMREIGTAMHRSASRFALRAKEGELQPAVEALARVTEQCAACHAAYRVH